MYLLWRPWFSAYIYRYIYICSSASTDSSLLKGLVSSPSLIHSARFVEKMPLRWIPAAVMEQRLFGSQKSSNRSSASEVPAEAAFVASTERWGVCSWLDAAEESALFSTHMHTRAERERGGEKMSGLLNLVYRREKFVMWPIRWKTRHSLSNCM